MRRKSSVGSWGGKSTPERATLEMGPPRGGPDFPDENASLDSSVRSSEEPRKSYLLLYLFNVSFLRDENLMSTSQKAQQSNHTTLNTGLAPGPRALWRGARRVQRDPKEPPTRAEADRRGPRTTK